MVFLDKYGYPVTGFRGRWFVNLLRKCLYARKIRRGYWNGYRVVKGVQS